MLLWQQGEAHIPEFGAVAAVPAQFPALGPFWRASLHPGEYSIAGLGEFLEISSEPAIEILRKRDLPANWASRLPEELQRAGRSAISMNCCCGFSASTI